MALKVKQLTHAETTNLSKTFPIVVVCEDFHSPQNIGMVFRIGDAMGITHLYLTGNSPTLPNRKISKTSRSADTRVAYSHHLDTASLLQQLKQAGYNLIGLEITNQSQDIRSFDFTSLEKIAFVAGAERSGISEATLQVLDATVHIPMYGVGTSMNVVTALSIGLYELTKQLE